MTRVPGRHDLALVPLVAFPASAWANVPARADVPSGLHWGRLSIGPDECTARATHDQGEGGDRRKVTSPSLPITTWRVHVSEYDGRTLRWLSDVIVHALGEDPCGDLMRPRGMRGVAKEWSVRCSSGRILTFGNDPRRRSAQVEHVPFRARGLPVHQALASIWWTLREHQLVPVYLPAGYGLVVESTHHTIGVEEVWPDGVPASAILVIARAVVRP